MTRTEKFDIGDVSFLRDIRISLIRIRILVILKFVKSEFFSKCYYVISFEKGFQQTRGFWKSQLNNSSALFGYNDFVRGFNVFFSNKLIVLIAVSKCKSNSAYFVLPSSHRRPTLCMNQPVFIRVLHFPPSAPFPVNRPMEGNRGSLSLKAFLQELETRLRFPWTLRWGRCDRLTPATSPSLTQMVCVPLFPVAARQCLWRWECPKQPARLSRGKRGRKIPRFVGLAACFYF